VSKSDKSSLSMLDVWIFYPNFGWFRGSDSCPHGLDPADLSCPTCGYPVLYQRVGNWENGLYIEIYSPIGSLAPDCDVPDTTESEPFRTRPGSHGTTHRIWN